MIRAGLPWLVSMFVLTPLLCRCEEPAKPERIAVTGQVVDEKSQGVAGIKVTALGYTDDLHTTTDEQGRFTLNVPGPRVSVLFADDPDNDRLGIYSPYNKPPSDAPIKIVLAKSQHVLVEVLDADGKPAPGVTVGVVYDRALPTNLTDAAGKAELRVPRGEKINSIYAFQPEVGFDFHLLATSEPGTEQDWLKQLPIRLQLAKSQPIRIRLVDSADKPIVGTPIAPTVVFKPHKLLGFTATNLFRVTTDAEGIAVFRGIPANSEMPFAFRPENTEYAEKLIGFYLKDHPDGSLTVKLHHRITARGLVLFADGKPAAGIRVLANGASFTWDHGRGVATTDDAGRFEMQLDPEQFYMFTIKDKKWAAPAIDAVADPDKPIEGLKFELRPATRIHGRVTVGPDAKPVAGQRMSLYQEGRSRGQSRFSRPEYSSPFARPQVSQSGTTDDKGEFEFFAGPGKFTLSGPTQIEAKKVDITDQAEIELNFDSPRNERGPIAGLVVTGEPPQPVANATVEGYYRSGSPGARVRSRTNADGRFSGERELHRTELYAKSPDGKLAGIVEIEPDAKEATIRIAPTASIRGRVLDERTRAPLSNTRIHWGHTVATGYAGHWGGDAITGDDGSFEAAGLVVGQEYHFSVPLYRTRILTFTPKAAGEENVGELTARNPDGPTVAERYDTAVKESPLFHQHVLVVFFERDQPVTLNWFKLSLVDRKVRTELYNFKFLNVDAKAAGAAALAEKLGVDITAAKLPAWAIRDADGHVLEQGKLPVNADDGLVDRTAVLEKLKHFAPERIDGWQLLKDALADAAKTNRRVIVQETATWSEPCHLLALYLDAHRTIWQKDFIWIQMDQRWTNCDEVMGKLRERRGDIPWCAILDAEGKTLATSDGPKGNIGLPSRADGIEHFVQMLKSTKQRLTEEDVAALRKDLEKK